MRYLGGKARQAKAILQAVQDHRGERTEYLEPFLGGGSVFAKVAPEFRRATASDIVPELIILWRNVIGGWIPPSTLSEEEWHTLRDGPPCALKGWAAYAASYNGKYFAGYGPTAPSAGRDYLAESQRAIVRKAESIRQTRIRLSCCDYASHTVDANTVVYCDPPYAGTEQYEAAKTFDHARFWRVMDQWAATGALVLVHEYEAPAHWAVIHEAARVETMHHGGPSSGARTERLFMHRPCDGS